MPTNVGIRADERDLLAAMGTGDIHTCVVRVVCNVTTAERAHMLAFATHGGVCALARQVQADYSTCREAGKFKSCKRGTPGGARQLSVGAGLRPAGFDEELRP